MRVKQLREINRVSQGKKVDEEANLVLNPRDDPVKPSDLVVLLGAAVLQVAGRGRPLSTARAGASTADVRCRSHPPFPQGAEGTPKSGGFPVKIIISLR